MSLLTHLVPVSVIIKFKNYSIWFDFATIHHTQVLLVLVWQVIINPKPLIPQINDDSPF